MKKILTLLSLFICFTLTYSQKTIFVSPKGNDSNDGSISKPFLSLNKTFNELKESINSGKAANETTIFLRAGVYYIQNTINFDSITFNKVSSKIIIRSYKDENVILTGAKKITGFTKLIDEKVLERISKEFRDKIYSINLKTNGVTDYGEISMRGSGGMEFFFNDERMTLSRFPNSGWLKIADIPQTGDSLYNKGLDREKRYDGVPAGRHYGKINYDGNRPNGWSKENEIYLHGFWTFDWSDSYQKVKSINPDKHEITIAEPHHHYGYTKNQRYYFVNILEELDTPGEWYLDRKLGLLYFYAPSDPNKGIAEVSILNEPFIKLNSTNDVTIEGITFNKTRSSAILINGGKNNLVAGCKFRLIGDVVIDIEGGTNNGVLSSDIYDVALGGITLNAGDRKTLTASGSFVKNCNIHDYSKWVPSGYLGIRLSGVGNLVSNNLIYNAPHEGIYISGNDQILEYNEIYNVCTETGDAGATHTGRNYTWRGNIYRYNYFHHLKGPGLHGVTAIYLDDFSSGYHVYGNICYKSGRGALVGGGRDNLIENNIFIDCHPSIVLDARGLSWASYYFDGTYPYLFTTLDEMNYSQPPYVTKYPILKNIKEDQPAVPKNNKFLNNISYGGRWVELLDYFAYDFKKEITFKNNLIADKEVCKRIKEDPKGWEKYYLNLDNSEGYRIYKNTDAEIIKEFSNDMIIDKDPGFVNYAKQDFRLKKDSPAYKLGFKDIPIEKIGLYKDKYRKILPVKQTKFDF